MSRSTRETIQLPFPAPQQYRVYRAGHRDASVLVDAYSPAQAATLVSKQLLNFPDKDELFDGKGFSFETVFLTIENASGTRWVVRAEMEVTCNLIVTEGTEDFEEQTTVLTKALV